MARIQGNYHYVKANGYVPCMPLQFYVQSKCGYNLPNRHTLFNLRIMFGVQGEFVYEEVFTKGLYRTQCL